MFRKEDVRFPAEGRQQHGRRDSDGASPDAERMANTSRALRSVTGRRGMPPTSRVRARQDSRVLPVSCRVLQVGRNTMSEEITYDRRRLLGTAALMFAAGQFGMIGAAQARSGTTQPAHQPAIEGQPMRPASVHYPLKGSCPSLGGATGWLNSPPLRAVRPTRESRPHQHLDLYLHQLAAPAAVCPRVGREIHGARIRRDRRALAGVRL